MINNGLYANIGCYAWKPSIKYFSCKNAFGFRLRDLRDILHFKSRDIGKDLSYSC